MPKAAEPKGQSSGGDGPSTALLAGVAVAGLVVIIVVLVVGILCALKIRTRSKSVTLPDSVSPIGFGEQYPE